MKVNFISGESIKDMEEKINEFSSKNVSIIDIKITSVPFKSDYRTSIYHTVMIQYKEEEITNEIE